MYPFTSIDDGKRAGLCVLPYSCWAMDVASGADCCLLLPPLMLATGPGDVFFRIVVGRWMLLPVLIVVSFSLL